MDPSWQGHDSNRGHAIAARRIPKSAADASITDLESDWATINGQIRDAPTAASTDTLHYCKSWASSSELPAVDSVGTIRGSNPRQFVVNHRCDCGAVEFRDPNTPRRQFHCIIAAGAGDKMPVMMSQNPLVISTRNEGDFRETCDQPRPELRAPSRHSYYPQNSMTKRDLQRRQEPIGS